MQIEDPLKTKSRIRAELSTNLFGGFRQELLRNKDQINNEKKRSIRSEDIEVNESVQHLRVNETYDGVSETITRGNNLRKKTKLVTQMMNVSLDIDLKLQFSQKFKLGSTLGEGAHAVVKKAKNLVGETVAVKICRSGDPEIIKTFIDTYRIARILNHHSILQCYEIYVDEQTEQLQLVMEYCKYPSLERILKQQKQMREETVRNLMMQIFEAVCHMNERGVAHRDLKPDNILIDEYSEGNKIKIIDFGVSAKFISYNSTHAKLQVKINDMWTRTGNYLYCAPEIFEGVGYTEVIDMWACGIIMFQCLYGQLPFQEDSIFSTIESIRQGWVVLPDSKISKLAKDLLFRLLQVDPTKRLQPEGFQKLQLLESLQHPWFYVNLDHEDQGQNVSLVVRQKSRGGSQTVIRSLQNFELDKETARKKQSPFDQNKYARSNSIHELRRNKQNLKTAVNHISKQKTPSPIKEKFMKEISEGLLEDAEDFDECYSPLIKMSKLKQKIEQEIHIVKKQNQTFGSSFIESSWAKSLKNLQDGKIKNNTHKDQVD